jgi:hypothetical protein
MLESRLQFSRSVSLLLYNFQVHFPEIIVPVPCFPYSYKMLSSAYSPSFSNLNHEAIILKIVLYVYRLPWHSKWVCWKSVSMSGLSKPVDMFIRCSKRTWSRLLWGLFKWNLFGDCSGQRSTGLMGIEAAIPLTHQPMYPHSKEFPVLLLEPLYHLDFV